MKIVGVDNFDRENTDDQLVAENVKEGVGRVMVEALNTKFCNHDNAPIYYRLVPDDYKLRKFEI